MIMGVKMKKLDKYPDDRGFFMELLRRDEGIFTDFGQASLSLTYPGVVKAFHYHKKQADYWFFPVGNAQVVLYDLREDSPTKGQRDVYYLGEHNPLLLYIPRLVAHGYRVLGNQPAIIVYFTTKPYNREAPDEYRLPWDDPRIDFAWQTKNR